MKVLYTRLAIYRDSILIYISINHFKKTIFILFFIYNFNKIKNSINQLKKPIKKNNIKK